MEPGGSLRTRGLWALSRRPLAVESSIAALEPTTGTIDLETMTVTQRGTARAQISAFFDPRGRGWRTSVLCHTCAMAARFGMERDGTGWAQMEFELNKSKAIDGNHLSCFGFSIALRGFESRPGHSRGRPQRRVTQ